MRHTPTIVAYPVALSCNVEASREGWDDIDHIMAYVEANTDQGELAKGRVVESFDW